MQAARQAEEVAQVLAQAQGWRGLHQAQRGIAARRVVQQAQHALRRLGDVLGGTLAPRDFVRAAAAAVDALAERAGGRFRILGPVPVSGCQTPELAQASPLALLCTRLGCMHRP